MRIGIVGGGFVGGATALLKCDDIDVITYDLDPSRCSPPGTTIKDLIGLDFVFVCVPTPSYSDWSCNTTIVEKCIHSLRENGVENIVLRSTVPPGTSEKLNVAFMPEFLTEANWRSDFYRCNAWVFAAISLHQMTKFKQLIDIAFKNDRIVSNTVIFTNTSEAELIKYARNNFLAMKVSFFNEIHSLCKKLNISFENVRNAVTQDPRIGKSHSSVPGPDGHYGFGGTCLPKDTFALYRFMESQGVPSYIVKAIADRNYTEDRPEHDWEKDPRAFTSKP